MRKLTLVLGLVLAGCVSAPGAADQPAPFTPAAVAAPTVPQAANYPIALDLPAGAYSADANHTSVTWRVRHQGLAWFTARFATKTASLTLDPADPTRSSLQATIDANSVDTGILNSAGERRFDGEIARAIGAGANPQISFRSTAITRTGEHTGQVTGDLTLNGQTHPVTLDVVYDGGHTDPLRGRTVLGFSATTTFARSQWGVTQWGAFVGDDVQLVIEAEFVKS